MHRNITIRIQIKIKYSFYPAHSDINLLFLISHRYISTISMWSAWTITSYEKKKKINWNIKNS